MKEVTRKTAISDNFLKKVWLKHGENMFEPSLNLHQRFASVFNKEPRGCWKVKHSRRSGSSSTVVTTTQKRNVRSLTTRTSFHKEQRKCFIQITYISYSNLCFFNSTYLLYACLRPVVRGESSSRIERNGSFLFVLPSLYLPQFSWL